MVLATRPAGGGTPPRRCRAPCGRVEIHRAGRRRRPTGTRLTRERERGSRSGSGTDCWRAVSCLPQLHAHHDRKRPHLSTFSLRFFLRFRLDRRPMREAGEPIVAPAVRKRKAPTIPMEQNVFGASSAAGGQATSTRDLRRLVNPPWGAAKRLEPRSRCPPAPRPGTPTRRGKWRWPRPPPRAGGFLTNLRFLPALSLRRVPPPRAVSRDTLSSSADTAGRFPSCRGRRDSCPAPARRSRQSRRF